MCAALSWSEAAAALSWSEAAAALSWSEAAGGGGAAAKDPTPAAEESRRPMLLDFFLKTGMAEGQTESAQRWRERRGSVRRVGEVGVWGWQGLHLFRFQGFGFR